MAKTPEELDAVVVGICRGDERFPSWLQINHDSKTTDHIQISNIVSINTKPKSVNIKMISGADIHIRCQASEVMKTILSGDWTLVPR